MRVMLFRLEYHRGRGEGGGREGIITCIYHIAKHQNPLEDWFTGEMEIFGAGGDESTGLVVVILEIKTENQLVIGAERGTVGVN